MALDNGHVVAQHDPLHNLGHVFEVFAEFRRNKDYTGLVDYLLTHYTANVKNRTFNFGNGGHTFHMLYAYVPSVSSKERKQIRLDSIEKLIKSTTNDFNMYVEVRNLMTREQLTNTCPCELIQQRLEQNIFYSESLKQKTFDLKPVKLKKEPIDAVLYKYSVNWKQSLKKKYGSAVSTGRAVVKRPSVLRRCSNNVSRLRLQDTAPSSLHTITGYTVKSVCVHDYATFEKQLRAGDEAVSFVTVCKLCGMSPPSV